MPPGPVIKLRQTFMNMTQVWTTQVWTPDGKFVHSSLYSFHTCWWFNLFLASIVVIPPSKIKQSLTEHWYIDRACDIYLLGKFYSRTLLYSRRAYYSLRPLLIMDHPIYLRHTKFFPTLILPPFYHMRPRLLISSLFSASCWPPIPSSSLHYSTQMIFSLHLKHIYFLLASNTTSLLSPLLSPTFEAPNIRRFFLTF